MKRLAIIAATAAALIPSTANASVIVNGHSARIFRSHPHVVRFVWNPLVLSSWYVRCADATPRITETWYSVSRDRDYFAFSYCGITRVKSWPHFAGVNTELPGA